MSRKIPARRRFLQQVGALGGVAAVPMIFTPSKTRAATALNLLAWYGNGESDVVGPFEDAHNVKVKSKYYTGGDNMLALISQSPPGTYDVVLSDAEYVTQLRQANYLEKLDPSDYPFDDFFPEFRRYPVPGFWENDDLYAVPISFGFLGLTYNTDVIDAEAARSYQLLWHESVKGKVGHFDWGLPNMGCISLYDGNESPFDIDARAFKRLGTTVLSLRPQVKGFFDYGGVLSSLRNGEVTVMCGIGDWISGVLEKDGAPITTAVPEEGGIQFTEGLGIGKGSDKIELARKLIQYLASPEGQVRKALMKAYPTAVPNRKAWERLMRENPAEAKRARMDLNGDNMMRDIRAGRIKLRRLPVQQSLESWNDLWLEYKNS